MITNAKDRKLFDSPGTLPNVSGALRGRLRSTTFGLIRKTIDQTTFENSEQEEQITTMASRQPYKPTEQEIQAAGSRSWKWERFYTLPGLALKSDDRVIFRGVPYRVMSVFDWADNGFLEYKLCEDYRP